MQCCVASQVTEREATEKTYLSLLRERVHSHTRCICCLGVTPFFFGKTGELFIRWELISAPDSVLEGVFAAAGQRMSTHILHSRGGHFLL